jgi:hypothetical protein
MRPHPHRTVRRAFEKLLDQIDGVVQIVVVHIAAIESDLSLELWPKLRPVALEDVAEIVVFTPILRHGVIDLSRSALSQIGFG